VQVRHRDRDAARCQPIGYARRPFDRTAFAVKDGRKAALQNSGFGTVYGTVAGEPLPVCDYSGSGYAPFGFGHRRCPGEQLTIWVFADFLRKVWVGFASTTTTSRSCKPSAPLLDRCNVFVACLRYSDSHLPGLFPGR
jgi:hypothetical protein